MRAAGPRASSVVAARLLAASLLAGALLLPGCLPKSSLARQDEAQADLYSLVLDVAVRTEGLDLPPFTWHVEGTVGSSYARSFRDGSMGHLVRLEGMSATTKREGGAATPTPVGFEGAFVEVRAFPDGEVLAVSGASPWIGNPGHLEVLDMLWPVVSPHLPGSKKEAAEPFVTSWPTWVEAGPRLRTRLTARWAPTDGAWTYDGTLAGHGGYADVAGTASGTVTLGDESPESPRLLSHTFDWTRTVTTTWMGGARIVQTQHVVGALSHRGAAPAPLLDMPLGAGDASADARALHLRDGRRVEERPVDLAGSLPFLLLPDDLPPDARARLVSAVHGAGSM